MLYHITRGGQTYGPYTLADLQRYVASGHVLPTDLAKSDEMTEWVTLSQILNPAGLPPAQISGEPAGVSGLPMPGYAPRIGYAQQPAAPVNAFRDPPNLHWGLVLLFNCLTCGIFQLVWNFVIAAWVKRIQPNSQGLLYYGAGYALQIVSSSLSFSSWVVVLHGGVPHASGGLGFLGLIALIIRIVGHFNIKSSLEEHFNTVEPINFRMSGVLTFIFGGLYIQSQLNRINEIKQAIRYRDFGR